jgi:hypothetical protein
VAPYQQHMGQLEDALAAMLSDRDFDRDQRTRFLLLEGPEDFSDAYPNPDDEIFATTFAQEHPVGTPLGDIVGAGGFQRLIRDTSLAVETSRQLRQVVITHLADQASSQGLRFRSSSTVEDIEGFNGAGLYDSNTGFLDPELAVDEGDRKKSLEWALLKTWSSYWGFEAFEERHRENVDHRSGGMAVLVHARFDDELELNNGVATVTLHADGGADVVINALAGAISVTNPDGSGLLPEEIAVSVAPDGRSEIVAITRSQDIGGTEQEAVLDRQAVDELVAQLQRVAEWWRRDANQSLSEAQRVQTVVLDYEFRTVAAGWPEWADGSSLPRRIVLKQVRSLDPGLRGLPTEVLDLAVGRDILARARSVTEISCDDLVHHEILTDPLLEPDLGYSDEPLIVGRAPSIQGEADDCERRVLFLDGAGFLERLLETGTPLLAVGP